MTLVYVELLDEGVDVWRPVAAEHLGGDLYHLIGERPENEVWPFATGDVVKCQLRKLSGDYGKLSDMLVAYEKSDVGAADNR
jgi:hypothetical protein